MSAQEKKRLKRIKEFVINRDGMICCYCDLPLSYANITMDHILPDSKRGTFNTTNLTVACAKCNNKRGNKPFFDYCKQFNFDCYKLDKYKKLYFDNLRIKVLNIAKEECLKKDVEVPNNIIKQACNILKIKTMNFSIFEKQYPFEIKFNESGDRKQIKFIFEQLIKIIEMDS